MAYVDKLVLELHLILVLIFILIKQLNEQSFTNFIDIFIVQYITQKLHMLP